MDRDRIRRVNEKLAEAYGGRMWVNASFAAEISAFDSIKFDEHAWKCAGRVCHNPEHVGEKVIDVQAMPERKAIAGGGE